jgi:uncharacterized protein
MHSISRSVRVEKQNSRWRSGLLKSAQIVLFCSMAVLIIIVVFSWLPSIHQQRFMTFFHGASASSIVMRPIWKRGRIGEKAIEMEVAATEDVREQGLMFRTQLPPNHGMLFVYPSARWIEMWMKNTLIPLDVAFLNGQGIIINIETMEPLTLTHHPSKGYAFYSLEMAGGWFAKNGIRPGMRVEGLPDYRYAAP